MSGSEKGRRNGEKRKREEREREEGIILPPNLRQ